MGLRGRTIFGNTGGTFFITTSVVQLDKIFGLGDEYYEILCESLKFVLFKYRTKLLAYVFMPSHMHFIIAIPDGETVSGFMRDFKKYTSTRVRQQLEKEQRYSVLERLRTNAQGKKNQTFKLWMDRFDDLVIDQENTLRVKIEYIHNNPVKAGLVKDVEAWKYSSARNYMNDDHSIIEVDTDGR